MGEANLSAFGRPCPKACAHGQKRGFVRAFGNCPRLQFPASRPWLADCPAMFGVGLELSS